MCIVPLHFLVILLRPSSVCNRPWQPLIKANVSDTAKPSSHHLDESSCPRSLVFSRNLSPKMLLSHHIFLFLDITSNWCICSSRKVFFFYISFIDLLCNLIQSNPLSQAFRNTYILFHDCHCTLVFPLTGSSPILCIVTYQVYPRKKATLALMTAISYDIQSCVQAWELEMMILAFQYERYHAIIHLQDDIIDPTE
jgi:hypothetical protein